MVAHTKYMVDGIALLGLDIRKMGRVKTGRRLPTVLRIQVLAKPERLRAELPQSISGRKRRTKVGTSKEG
jgi:hypothetical protein